MTLDEAMDYLRREVERLKRDEDPWNLAECADLIHRTAAQVGGAAQRARLRKQR